MFKQTSGCTERQGDLQDKQSSRCNVDGPQVSKQADRQADKRVRKQTDLDHHFGCLTIESTVAYNVCSLYSDSQLNTLV